MDLISILSCNECTLPFIVQEECLHCAGPRQVGPAYRSLFYERYLRSPLYREVDVRICSQHMAVCSLACTVTAVSVTQQ
jgi:hypothetical protein